jgi:hypothetical protein
MTHFVALFEWMSLFLDFPNWVDVQRYWRGIAKRTIDDEEFEGRQVPATGTRSDPRLGKFGAVITGEGAIPVSLWIGSQTSEKKSTVR